MYKYLVQKGPTIAFLATVALIVISLIPIFSGLEAFDKVPQAQQSYSAEGGIFSAGIYISVILMIVAVIATLLFSIYQVATNPKGSMMGLISFGALLVLFLIFYSMSDAKGTGSLAGTIERFALTDGISKIISGGIGLTILLGIASVVVAIVMEVWNYFKNQ